MGREPKLGTDRFEQDEIEGAFFDVFDDLVEIGCQEGGGKTLQNREGTEHDRGFLPFPPTKGIAILIKQRQAEETPHLIAKAGDAGDQEIQAIFHFGSDRGTPEQFDQLNIFAHNLCPHP